MYFGPIFYICIFIKYLMRCSFGNHKILIIAISDYFNLITMSIDFIGFYNNIFQYKLNIVGKTDEYLYEIVQYFKNEKM